VIRAAIGRPDTTFFHYRVCVFPLSNLLIPPCSRPSQSDAAPPGGSLRDPTSFHRRHDFYVASVEFTQNNTTASNSRNKSRNDTTSKERKRRITQEPPPPATGNACCAAGDGVIQEEEANRLTAEELDEPLPPERGRSRGCRGSAAGTSTQAD